MDTINEAIPISKWLMDLQNKEAPFTVISLGRYVIQLYKQDGLCHYIKTRGYGYGYCKAKNMSTRRNSLELYAVYTAIAIKSDYNYNLSDDEIKEIAEEWRLADDVKYLIEWQRSSKKCLKFGNFTNTEIKK